MRTVLTELSKGGIKDVTLLGGEPTLRSDLTEIVSHASDLDLTISINTNLIDAKGLLIAANLDAIRSIVVSLDGISPATHNAVRGRGSFEKTMLNLAMLLKHKRVRSGSLVIDMTFVLTAANRSEVPEIAEFAIRHGVRKVNFKTLQYNDRAEKNREKLSVEGRDLLDAIVEFYVSCAFAKDLIFSLYVPPALGDYLSEVAGAPSEIVNRYGCGGTNVYSYVDLLGNNLPCPAMSFEENQNSPASEVKERINLTKQPIEAVHNSSLFRGFDISIAKRRRLQKMVPCSSCIYQSECSPCTNEIIRGSQYGGVSECLAVRDYGDQRVSGISSRLFSV